MNALGGGTICLYILFFETTGQVLMKFYIWWGLQSRSSHKFYFCPYWFSV